MADESSDNLLSAAPEAPVELIVVAEELEIHDSQAPTESKPVSALDLSSLTINHAKPEDHEEPKIVIHEQEPEVSFEGHTDQNGVPPSPWRSGMTPRALQVEASHAEEMERLKAELDAARADSARLLQQVAEKDIVIANQKSQLDQLSQSSAPTTTKPATGAKTTATISTPKKLPPAATASPSVVAARKKAPVASPSAKKVTPAPTKVAKTTTPKAPPAPVAVAKAPAGGGESGRIREPGKLHLARTSAPKATSSAAPASNAKKPVAASPKKQTAKVTSKASSAKPVATTHAPPAASSSSAPKEKDPAPEEKPKVADSE